MPALKLAATMLLASGLLAAPYDASAATPTCHGRAATIVGSPGRTVTGTDGDDVVVTNGAVKVATHAGDDLVCATGAATLLRIDTGSGADTVDTTAVSYASHTVLAPASSGAPSSDLDTFVGGPGADTVTNNGAGPVSISTGGGDDVVTATIQTGNSTYDGGSGVNTLHVIDPPGSENRHDWVFDDVQQVAVRNSSHVLAWNHFTGFVLDLPRTTYFSFVGSDASESLRVVSDIATKNDGRVTGRLDADMGGGDDTVTVHPGNVNLDGGSGRDSLLLDPDELLFESGVQHLLPSDAVDLDLTAGRLRFEPNRGTPVTGFENATITVPRHATAADIDFTGNAAANRFEVHGGGCSVTLAGNGGNDVLAAAGAAYCPGRHAVTRRLSGGPGNDRLLGSPARGTANGGPGFDTCRALRRIACER